MFAAASIFFTEGELLGESRHTLEGANFMKILIGDEDDGLRRLIVELLSTAFDGSEITEVYSGLDAVERCLALQPDLALLDIRMADMDGLEAARLISAAGSKAHILIMSVFDIEEYDVAALACGAAGYVAKQRMMRDLIPTIEKIMSAEAGMQ